MRNGTTLLLTAAAAATALAVMLGWLIVRSIAQPIDRALRVAEAVADLTANPLTVLTAEVPGETRLATLHLSMSDKTGDSAIVEYIGGKQVIHHSRDYQVMTNSPIFEKQLAINEYWNEIGGVVMLPGTNRAADTAT